MIPNALFKLHITETVKLLFLFWENDINLTLNLTRIVDYLREHKTAKNEEAFY